MSLVNPLGVELGGQKSIHNYTISRCLKTTQTNTTINESQHRHILTTDMHKLINYMNTYMCIYIYIYLYLYLYLHIYIYIYLYLYLSLYLSLSIYIYIYTCISYTIHVICKLSAEPISRGPLRRLAPPRGWERVFFLFLFLFLCLFLWILSLLLLLL